MVYLNRNIKITGKLRGREMKKSRQNISEGTLIDENIQKLY